MFTLEMFTTKNILQPFARNAETFLFRATGTQFQFKISPKTHVAENAAV